MTPSPDADAHRHIGPSDVGAAPVDSSPPYAGLPPDAGLLPDAGLPPDSGLSPDAGLPPDAEPATGVGVGPWPGGPTAWPRLADGGLDPRFDVELLANGDRRNVLDRYRYWTVEAIVADLDARRHPLHVAIENWGHDLNIGSVVRTANAFNVAGVHVVGRRRWNRRGAMVTDRYLHVHHHPDASALAAWDPRLPVVGIDNVPGSIPIESYDFPRECVLLFGQESSGLTPAAQAVCVDVVHITQYGSTRSMNAGAAAAIAMYAWATQHAAGR